MTDVPRDERRVNRRYILDALMQRGTLRDGDSAGPRVDDYRRYPINATPGEFTYVGALTLNRFYKDSATLAKDEATLWRSIVRHMRKRSTPNPGGWDTGTTVTQLQSMIEGVM